MFGVGRAGVGGVRAPVVGWSSGVYGLASWLKVVVAAGFGGVPGCQFLGEVLDCCVGPC